MEEAVTPGSYVDLLPGDQLVVPADTPFAVQTGQYDPAGLAALIVFPSGPPARAPDVLYWEWWSWGTVAAWPSGPVEVRFDSVQLAPGESAPLPARAWPQLLVVDSGPPLRLMLASGGGETMPAGGVEGKQPVDLAAIGGGAPGTAGTPGGGTSLRGSKRPITPGTEATIGGPLQSEAAFLSPGSGGTLRNPSEASEPIGIIVVSFGESTVPHGNLVRAPYRLVRLTAWSLRSKE
jgi:hypothetical protein